MATNWCPGATVVASSHDGGSMLGTDKYCGWHTYEAGYALGAVEAAHRLIDAGNEVHLTFNPVDGSLAQMLPANRAGRGYRNEAGGVQTNRQGLVNIQIEVIAFSSRPWLRDLTPAGKATLTKKIIPWIDSHGTPRRHANGDQGCGGPNGPFNRSVSGWNSPGGWFCHAQVPENTHWDHGTILFSDMWALAAPDQPGADMAITEDDARAIWTKYAIVKDMRAADPNTAPRVTPSTLLEFIAGEAKKGQVPPEVAAIAKAVNDEAARRLTS